jgi:FAD/FMN-containing dehydrogenase
MEEFIMSKKPFINEEHDVEWINWHKTKNVGGQVSRLFKPYNRYDDHTTTPQKAFVPGLAGLREIVKRAGDANKRVRAYGARWSLNNIAFSNEYLVDSTELNYCLVGLANSRHVSPGFEEKRDRLAFVQCGVRVKELNRKLQEKNLALKTSGASDGQTFVAAVSTGTHGSAHSVGSMQDYVRGIHLVTSAEECVFIQRESAPAVTSAFCTWLGRTRLIQDDELFNAALVGFGSFGLVHGLLIETEPIYILERFIKNYHFSEVEEAISTLNMKGLGLPKGDKLPFHFETVLNPYGKRHGKNAFVRVMYKDIFQTPKKTFEHLDHPKRENDLIHSMERHFAESESGIAGDNSAAGTADNNSAAGIGDDNSAPAIGETGWFVQVGLKASFPSTAPGILEFNFPGDQFHGSSSDNEFSPYPLNTTSIEIGVPLNRVMDAVKIIFDVTKDHKFVAPLALRYVKSSSAMLAFTRYSPITVTMEMPGLDNGHARRGHQAIFAALAGSDVPHTYHWGQGLPLNPDWVSKSYGDETIKSWKRRRLELLGEQGCRIFSNTLLETIGLHNI